MKKYHKYSRIFRTPDGGGSGSFNMPNIELDKSEPLDDPEPEPDAGGEGNEPEPEAKPTALTIDPASFVEAFKAAGLGGTGKPTPEPKAPPTPEQILAAKKELGYFQVTPEFASKFGNLDTQAEAIQELYDKASEYAIRVAQAIAQQQSQQFDTKLSRYEQAEQQRNWDKFNSDFDSEYEQFKDPNLLPFRYTIMQQLLESGKTFKSPAEARKAVAEEMTKVIKVTNPNFVLSGGSTPSKAKPNGLKPAPRGGGAGGGSNTSDPNTGKAPGLANFPPLGR